MKRYLLALTFLAIFTTMCEPLEQTITSPAPSSDTQTAPQPTKSYIDSSPTPSLLPPGPTAIVPRTVNGYLTCIKRSEITVQNPGFEQGGENPSNWDINGSTGFIFARDTHSALDGIASAYIKGSADAPLDYPSFSQTMPLADATGVLRMETRVRTRGVHGGWGAYLSISYLDQNRNRFSYGSSDSSAAGDSDWMYLTEIDDIPSGTKYISIALVLNGVGEAWFDSVSLVHIQNTADTVPPPKVADMALTSKKLQEQFFGFGFQNNPYIYASMNANVTEEEIGILETRIKQLQPRMVRVFFQPLWWDSNQEMKQALVRTLQLYEGIGTDINLTMQTFGMDDLTEDDFPALVGKVRDLLDYLMRTQRITRIRYLTLYNEPNYELMLPRSAYVRLYQMMADELQREFLPVELLGVDESNSLDFFYDLVPQLKPIVDAYSYHHYLSYHFGLSDVERVREHLACATDSGGGKPLFIWESNVHGDNPGTFSPGEIDGVLIIDRYEPMLSLAQFYLYGMNEGIAGFSYWEVFDMRYTPNLLMVHGLWAYQSEGWRIRPFYYMYGLFTRLTQSASEVMELSPAGCDQPLPAAAVRNPDGTQTIYVINPWQNEVTLSISGLSNGWTPRRYLVTEKIAADLSQANALFAESTAISIQSGTLMDILPPESMIAYSDAP
jgi:hypothetical protein